MRFSEWIIKNINEETRLEDLVLCENSTKRYSVEVNYRTNSEELYDAFARICLGYISAAMKKEGFHTKHVYEVKPIRLFISSRNWDDGEWVVSVAFDEKNNCFLIIKGFYNKDRNTISIISTKKTDKTSAASITAEIKELMESLKNEKDRRVEKIKGIPLKRGPKRLNTLNKRI